jgi:plastocyanin
MLQRTGLMLMCLALFQPATANPERLTFRVLSNSGEPVHSAVISAGEPLEASSNAEAEMDQIDKEFAPYVLPIQQGQSVAFPNKDNVRHHVYSFSPAKPFEIRLYSGRPGEPVDFDNSGVVVLGCNIHDNMVGYIYVTQRPYRASSDYSGEATLEVNSPISEVVVWHPNLSLDSQREISLQLAELKQVEEAGEVHYVVELDIPTPDKNPQAIRAPANRFDRFKID